MITIKANGVEYYGFTTVTVKSSIDELCKQFTVTCTSDDAKAFPLPRGTEIEIFIDGTSSLLGNIERINGSTSHGDSSVQLSGRDRAKVILKHDMPPKLNFVGPIALDRIMEQTLKKTGLNFKIIDKTEGIDSFSKKEILSAGVGSTIWDFWISLAEKRQVLITTDWESNIVIINPGNDKYARKIIHTYSDNRNLNNVISEDFTFDDTERRSQYQVRSQSNYAVRRDEQPPGDNSLWTPSPDPVVQNDNVDAVNELLANSEPGSERERVLKEQLLAVQSGAQVISSNRIRQIGVAYDNSITDGSVSYEKSERSSDARECERIAKWRANQARVNSVNYSCVVAGHTADSEPFDSGYIMDVESEPAGIRSPMLIRSAEMTMSRSGEDADETTSLTFTIPDGYTTDDSASDTQLRTGIVGDNWNASVFQ
jgi:prophage tail gpP-like protein